LRYPNPAIITFIFSAVVVCLSLVSASSWAQAAVTQGNMPPAKPSAVSAASAKPASDEDWSTPLLTGSKLHVEDTVIGETDKFPEFTRQILRVQWRTGDPIDLYIMRPSGVEKPPVILYLYGYPSETDRFRDNRYGERVTRDGFVAVGFVSALTGHRYHDRPMKKWFVSELQESLAASAHDVQMVLNYLATRKDLDMGHVGMVATGSGATIAILAAAADPRIQAIDLLDPWGEWPDWMAKSGVIQENERPDYMKPEFLARVAPLDTLHWLPKLQSRKVRLQEVLDDTGAPPAARQKIEEALPSSAEEIKYKDTGALLKASSGGRFFDWIKEQVAPPKTAQSKEAASAAARK
jgi:X-Pro dipeptidyl-peptidase (S15 family)